MSMFRSDMDPYDRLMLAEVRIQEICAVTEEQGKLLESVCEQLKHTASSLHYLHRMNLMLDHRIKILEERRHAHS